MVTLNKIYTKTGDAGMTSLGDGERIQKDSKRVITYGTVDELNSHVGLARLYCSKIMIEKLCLIQNDLFDLGADFCKPEAKLTSQKETNPDIRITGKQVRRIEIEIDEMNNALAPLKSFILPGGTPAATHLHICRTVCRRAERHAVNLAYSKDLNPNALKFLNRLSDWFFVASRHENGEDKGEVLWQPGSTNKPEQH